MSIREWPGWWDWELVFTPHLFKRMAERDFDEIDLRRMMHLARGLRRDEIEGRWVVESKNAGRRWEIIVEPELETNVLVVVSAFPVT